MTRPNRYPYTKNQWEEETTLVCFGDDTSFKLRVERNRMTGETKQCQGNRKLREALRGY